MKTKEQVIFETMEAWNKGVKSPFPFPKSKRTISSKHFNKVKRRYEKAFIEENRFCPEIWAYRAIARTALDVIQAKETAIEKQIEYLEYISPERYPKFWTPLV